MAKNKSKRDKTITLVLAIIGLVGVAGVHRFYAGKIGTGILWLLTGGLFYIGTIIDIIKIANDEFEDKEGKIIKE